MVLVAGKDDLWDNQLWYPAGAEPLRHEQAQWQPGATARFIQSATSLNPEAIYPNPSVILLNQSARRPSKSVTYPS